MFPRTAFKLADPASPHLKTYTFTQESGIPFTIQFCSNCSTSLGKTTEHEAFKQGFILFAGTLDEKFSETGKPEVEFWSQHKVDWVAPVEGTERIAAM